MATTGTADSSGNEAAHVKPFPMNRLPDELLIHIFSNLAPESLRSAACVCRRWNGLVHDDGSWRSAFVAFYGSAPYRRLATGRWRLEYTLRTQLLRLWQRGRCANVAFEPKIGPVDELDVDLRNQRLFAGSREKGLVAVCDPRTGRVNRDIVYAVRDEQEIAVSCLKLNNHRVLVGHTTGNVSYIANVKDGGSLSERLLFEDQHTAPVSCFKTITARDGSDDMLCSGDRAGQVRIWDFRSRTCLVVLDGDTRQGIVALHSDPKNRNLVALTDRGCLLIWQDLDYGELRSKMNVLKPTYCIDGPPLIGSDMVAVKKIMYASDLEVVGVVYARDIHFYDVRNGRLVARMPAASEGQAGEGHAAEIADVAWDIDTTLITNSNGSCEYERVFIVVSGDRFGKIAVWNGKTIARHVERQRQDPHLQALCFRPARTIQAHRDSITCVDVDAFKVTSVGADGYVRVWDIMLGRLLRTMNVRYFRHLARNRNEPIEPPVAVNEGGADPQLHANDRYIVRYIYTTLHQIVVAVNGQVKTWDLDPERVLARWSESGRKIKNKAKRRVSGANAAPKAELRRDLKRDLQESNRQLEYERATRDLYEKQARRANPLGLSEEELVSYALLLSLQTSPHVQPVMSGGSGSGSAVALPSLDLGMSVVPAITAMSPRGYGIGSSFTAVPFAENFMLTMTSTTSPTPPPMSEDAFPMLARSVPSSSGSLRSPRVSAYPISPPPVRKDSPMVVTSGFSLGGTSALSPSAGGAAATVASTSRPIAISSPSKHPLVSNNSIEARRKFSRKEDGDDGVFDEDIVSSSQKKSVTSFGGPQSLSGSSKAGSMPSRARKMSINEFLASPTIPSNVSGMSIERPPVFGSHEQLPIVGSLGGGGSLGATSSSLRHRASMEGRGRRRGGNDDSTDDDEHRRYSDDDEEEEDDGYDFSTFKNLTSPRFGSMSSGGAPSIVPSTSWRPTPQSPSPRTPRTNHILPSAAISNINNGTTVATSPAGALPVAMTASDLDDDELQYVLELSMVEK